MIKIVPDILEVFSTDRNGRAMVSITQRCQSEGDSDGTTIVLTVTEAASLVKELEQAISQARCSGFPPLEDI